MVGGCKHDLHDSLAQLIVDPADHSSIQYSYPTLGQRKDISRVWVGMVEPVAEDHLHENSSALASQRFAIDAPVFQFLPISRTGSPEPLHRQHAAGAQLGIRLGKGHGRVAREVPAELLKAAHLAAKIQFTQQRLPELPHQSDGLIPFPSLLLVGMLRERGQDVQIPTDRVFNTRMLHLNDDRSAIGQLCAVNLSDGC